MGIILSSCMTFEIVLQDLHHLNMETAPETLLLVSMGVGSIHTDKPKATNNMKLSC